MAPIAFFSSQQRVPSFVRKHKGWECDREAPRLFKSGDAAFFAPKSAFYKDGRYAVAFSGVLYEKENLKEMLYERGVKERMDADVRLLFYAFLHFKEKLPEKIDGAYALLIYDSAMQTMHAFCDRMSQKAIYYRYGDCGISISTEPSLASESPYACEKSLRFFLRTYMTLGYTVGEGAPYGDVQRIPQRHRLLFEKGKLSLFKWADLTFASADLECQSRLDSALRTALKTPPAHSALLLSGSVFSSLMAVFAKAEKAVSIRYEDGYQSAIPYRLAELFALKHESFAFTASDCLQGIAELAKKSPIPLADPAALSYFLLAKHASAPIACAEGGAELFGGHRDYFVSLPQSKLFSCFSKCLAPESVAAYQLGRTSVFSDSEALSLLIPSYRCAPSAKDNLRRYLLRSPSVSLQDKRQYADLCSFLSHNRLLAISQAFEANAKSVYLPYLDKTAVDVALSLPKSARAEREVSAPMFRSVAQKYLPIDICQSVLELPLPPLSCYLRTDLFANAMREVFSDPLALLFFDRHLLFSMLESHQNGTAEHSRKLFCAYVFLLWYESHRL